MLEKKYRTIVDENNIEYFQTNISIFKQIGLNRLLDYSAGANKLEFVKLFVVAGANNLNEKISEMFKFNNNKLHYKIIKYFIIEKKISLLNETCVKNFIDFCIDTDRLELLEQAIHNQGNHTKKIKSNFLKNTPYTYGFEKYNEILTYCAEKNLLTIIDVLLDKKFPINRHNIRLLKELNVKHSNYYLNSQTKSNLSDDFIFFVRDEFPLNSLNIDLIPFDQSKETLIKKLKELGCLSFVNMNHHSGTGSEMDVIRRKMLFGFPGFMNYFYNWFWHEEDNEEIIKLIKDETFTITTKDKYFLDKYHSNNWIYKIIKSFNLLADLEKKLENKDTTTVAIAKI